MKNRFFDKGEFVVQNFHYEKYNDKNQVLFIGNSEENIEFPRLVLETVKDDKIIKLFFGYSSKNRSKSYQRSFDLNLEQLIELRGFLSDYIDSFLLEGKC